MKSIHAFFFQTKMENLMQVMLLWEIVFCFISGALITLIIPGTVQLPLLRQDLKNLDYFRISISN